MAEQLSAPTIEGDRRVGNAIMTNEEYHNSEGVSCSHLKDIDPLDGKTPAHYYEKRLSLNRTISKETKSKKTGQASHVAILEPDLFRSRYTVVPDDAPRRPTVTQINAKKPSMATLDAIKWWAEFEDKNLGKTILTPDYWKTCVAIRDAAYRNISVRNLLSDGHAEQTFFTTDEETGELIKCRTDWIRSDGMPVDLKTCEDASPKAFAKAIVNWGYWMQAPWYTDILQKLFGGGVQPFPFIAIESESPHLVAVRYLNQDDVEYGRRHCRRLLRLIAECRRTNAWPGYSSEPEEAALPEYHKKRVRELYKDLEEAA